MCSVTFVPGRSGYVLGMNRDEQRSRLPALAPEWRRLRGRACLFPREQSGGTWTGVNDHGVTLALLNWYSVQPRFIPFPISRGTIIPALLPLVTPAGLELNLARLPLGQVNPFRLLAVFPERKRVIEWRWNQAGLERADHLWQITGWFSSGFDEPGAQLARERYLRRWIAQFDSERAAGWLRRLHASHSPEPGPYSFCMHREDAATVSYTEIHLAGSSVRMRYAPGNPCERADRDQIALKAVVDGSPIPHLKNR
jgi:hypothetical protein